jgi:hypothetical protein
VVGAAAALVAVAGAVAAVVSVAAGLAEVLEVVVPAAVGRVVVGSESGDVIRFLSLT